MQPKPDNEMRLAAFNQNHEAFRSLNNQMWQIPLIAMTLTGGLWFGVSAVGESAAFKLALLLLSFVGNMVLILIIQRLRFVMDGYLTWLREFDSSCFVAAQGDRWFEKGKVVRTCFQFMLGLAALVSAGLFALIGYQAWEKAVSQSDRMKGTVAYYDRHAEDLANSYESLSLEDAHPALLRMLSESYEGQKLSILDIGAGTGRDAAGLSTMGHKVTAVEPSLAMQKIGQRVHSLNNLRWVEDKLPQLEVISSSGERYDVIILSAVWMHLTPDQRKPALLKIMSLLNKAGTIYLTLRIGPEDKSRGIHPVSAEEFFALAEACGLSIKQVDLQQDLLGRSGIEWKSFTLKLPEAATMP